MIKESRVYKIAGSFLVFMLLFVLNLFVPVFSNVNHTVRMWLVLDVCVVVVSIILLIKNRLPTKKQIILSLIFGLLMFVAYRGFSFSSVKGFITTTLCALASFSIFCKYPVHAVLTLKNKHIKSVMFSLLIGFGVGCALGIVNLFLSGQALHFNFNLSCFLTALSPAILEEVCYRLLLFAYCLSLLGGEIQSKSENFWCYFMMIIPHVLIHTPDIFLSYGVVSGAVNILMLCLIFGLPFAILQLKRDLTSAMIAHGMVDVIRFSFLGVPF